MVVDSEALVKAVIDAAIAQPTKRFKNKNESGVEESDIGCKYFYIDTVNYEIMFDQPCCIIGHGLCAIGHGPDLIEGALDNGRKVFTVLHCANESEIDRERSRWLGCVQDAQDCGEPWAEAVLSAGPIS